jgi:phosphoglucosamine mutase
MGKYFGTDGIRGVANTEISPELAFRVGRFGGHVLTRNKNGHKAKIVIGQDTRVSGDMLEAALISGLLSIGADVIRLGVLPTPGVAYVTKAFGADAGVMISASHNPLDDNGIKFFGSDGYKLSDELEAEIEALLDSVPGRDKLIEQVPRPVGSGIGTTEFLHDLAFLRYFTHLKSTVQHRFDGLKIVLDCANGAASAMAPQLFSKLGAETIVLANHPDGLNINERCGSTHPDHVQQAVLEHKADLGLSFDGDADRLIAVDENGSIVDGDQILFVLAEDMAKKHRLKKNTVVTTVMSNLGFSKSLQSKGIDVKKSKVGDRYVMERMIQGGYNLGGEPSGHIIMLDYATTGDGLLSALQLTDVMISESKPLSQLVSGMTKYPQLLVNVRAENKHKLEENERIQQAIRLVEHRLGGIGRVLVRPSGTEPLVRVMVEGPNEGELPSFVETITEAIKDELSYRVV